MKYHKLGMIMILICKHNGIQNIHKHPSITITVITRVVI